ncbi:response regulator [Saccharothrix australiensis]|uniref:LuxR family two component transcriptional regulator n=1 Tax=Saccharothrix australiensis TaxID=2072 RepID=A0A495WAB3_9PSEU|nr:response regulator transcription factor [Saccharothrix australiensis]RKT56728.1 LuxR family two component transcriptional regulator [Saccharothrix australiensis]
MRVVIAEDDVLLREGLTLLLGNAGVDVVAAVDNATEFLAAITDDRPDAVVMDVRLPPSFRDEGLRAAVEARRRHPGLPVLVLSAYVENSYAAELLADGAGGVGYLLKERVGKVERFLDALRRVAEGGTAMDPEVISQLLVRRKADDPLQSLTGREREVLALMAEGHNNATIADTLVVSEGAVHKHIRNIFTKLALPDDQGGHRRVLAVLAYLNA